MRKLLLFLGLLLTVSGLFAQCSDLFFSEYVEGYSNNKGLEIYNPTSEAVDLSAYSIARFSNGSTTAGSNKIVQLPQVMLEPNDVYVVVVDLTDTTQWNSQYDKPVWNGYNLIDTLFDIVTGDPVLDSLGNVRFGPQYLDGSALFGDEYDEKYDMQCKADAFLTPTYEVNNTMYFNGNDAMALILGTEVEDDGSNLIDVIGVIGEDPEDTIMQDAWVSAEGYWLTKDRTLVRKPEVAGGRSELTQIVYTLGGTFTGEEWLSYPKNSFEYLGIHNSNCNTDPMPDQWSCLTGPVSSDYEINLIPFNMYPNPNSIGILNIDAAEQIERVEVYNLMGQMVYNESIKGAENTHAIKINRFNKGMYLVHLTFAKNQRSIQKLIVE